MALFILLFSQYEILIVEQDDNAPFNRGKLINIGAKISMKNLLEKCQKYDLKQVQENLCIISHDVDMIPLNRKMLYDCSHRYVIFKKSFQKSNNYFHPIFSLVQNY